jgi:two-component system cell cycle response regulator
MPIMILMNRAPLPDDAQSRTISEILSKSLSGGPLLARIKGSESRAMIILLDHLSLYERQLLEKSPHRVIDLEDDPLKTIVELQEENALLRSMALIDNLTGLYNNRFFHLQLETEMARTRRTGLPCCLLMIDLDNFKMINDTLGHLEGDRFIIQVARTFSQCVRAIDIVCRYGGDEFVAILPSTRLFVAIRIANRFKKAVSEIPGASGYNVSASIGISEFTVSSPWDVNDFIQAADSAMYDAKSNGRNQVSTRGRYISINQGLESVNPEERKAIFSVYENVQNQGDSDGE